jgi:hypothetical protein
VTTAVKVPPSGSPPSPAMSLATGASVLSARMRANRRLFGNRPGAVGEPHESCDLRSCCVCLLLRSALIGQVCVRVQVDPGGPPEQPVYAFLLRRYLRHRLHPLIARRANSRTQLRQAGRLPSSACAASPAICMRATWRQPAANRQSESTGGLWCSQLAGAVTRCSRGGTLASGPAQAEWQALRTSQAHRTAACAAWPSRAAHSRI